MKNKNTQDGLSIIELLIGLFLTSIVTIITIKEIKLINFSSKKIETEIKLQRTIEKISSLLQPKKRSWWNAIRTNKISERSEFKTFSETSN